MTMKFTQKKTRKTVVFLIVLLLLSVFTASVMASPVEVETPIVPIAPIIPVSHDSSGGAAENPEILIADANGNMRSMFAGTGIIGVKLLSGKSGDTLMRYWGDNALLKAGENHRSKFTLVTTPVNDIAIYIQGISLPTGITKSDIIGTPGYLQVENREYNDGAVVTFRTAYGWSLSEGYLPSEIVILQHRTITSAEESAYPKDTAEELRMMILEKVADSNLEGYETEAEALMQQEGESDEEWLSRLFSIAEEKYPEITVKAWTKIPAIITSLHPDIELEATFETLNGPIIMIHEKGGDSTTYPPEMEDEMKKVTSPYDVKRIYQQILNTLFGNLFAVFQ